MALVNFIPARDREIYYGFQNYRKSINKAQPWGDLWGFGKHLYTKVFKPRLQEKLKKQPPPRKSHGQKQYEAAQPQNAPNLKGSGISQMRSNIRPTYGGRGMKIAGIRRKRTSPQVAFFNKLAWKQSLRMIDTNVYRKSTLGHITWAPNQKAIAHLRVWEHNYDSAGGVGGAPRVFLEGAASSTAPTDVFGNIWDITQTTSAINVVDNSNYNPTNMQLQQTNTQKDPIIRLHMRQKTQMKFRNNTKQPAYGLIYKFVAKVDIPSNQAGDTGNSDSDQLPDALWKNYLGSDTAVQSNQTVAQLALTTLNAFMSDGKRAIKPIWKKTGFNKVELKPGDEYNIYIKNKPRIINMRNLIKRHQQAQLTNGAYTFKGETVIVSIWYGTVAHDHTDKTIQGFTGLGDDEGIDVIINKEYKTKILPVRGMERYYYTSSGFDELTVAGQTLMEGSAIENNDIN